MCKSKDYVDGMKKRVIQCNVFIRILAVGLFCGIDCGNESCCADDDWVVRKAATTATKVTVRLKVGGQLSSGVVIGRTGEILTVNHGLPANALLVTVKSFDGRTYDAKIVNRNERHDLALLKISGRDLPNEVAVVSTAASVSKQAVIAAGYPARASTVATALIRLGSVDQTNVDLIRSTCQLTVGDSGGGIFDLAGRLIGLNQRIGAGRWANIHATIKMCFERLPMAKSVATIDYGAAVSDRIRVVSNQPNASAKAVANAWNARTLQVLKPQRIQAVDDDAELLCHATLWTSDIAVTKLSELQQHEQVLLRTTDGEMVAAKLLQHDRRHDLALLSLQKSIAATSLIGPADCGLHQLVACSGDEPIGLAVVGRIKVDTAGVKAVLGCGLEIVDRQMKVDRISANSAAAVAHVLVGDVLVKVDGTPIHSFDDLAAKLEPLQPGDWTIFEVLRDGRPIICNVQLQHDSAMKLDRQSFLDGAMRAVSLRRTGFVNSIQHDGDLRPSEMGSPLLSLNGKLLGINIAVRSRETIIAIPAKTVQALIDSPLID